MFRSSPPLNGRFSSGINHRLIGQRWIDETFPDTDQPTKHDVASYPVELGLAFGVFQ